MLIRSSISHFHMSVMWVPIKKITRSDKIWTKGVIINSEITDPSNYRSLSHLNEWLKKNKIVGITGIDTRSLTNIIRDRGAPKGTISYFKKIN